MSLELNKNKETFRCGQSCRCDRRNEEGVGLQELGKILVVWMDFNKLTSKFVSYTFEKNKPMHCIPVFFSFYEWRISKKERSWRKTIQILKNAEGFILNLISNYFDFRLNNCVGHYNHRYFFLYMLFMCIGKSSFRCRPCFNRPLPSQLSEYKLFGSGSSAKAWFRNRFSNALDPVSVPRSGLFWEVWSGQGHIGSETFIISWSRII